MSWRRWCSHNCTIIEQLHIEGDKTNATRSVPPCCPFFSLCLVTCSHFRLSFQLTRISAGAFPFPFQSDKFSKMEWSQNKKADPRDPISQRPHVVEGLFHWLLWRFKRLLFAGFPLVLATTVRGTTQTLTNWLFRPPPSHPGKTHPGDLLTSPPPREIDPLLRAA